MFRHPLTIPQAVILDPEVTRHTPMWLLLSTGIRAVDHCVEGVCSNESTEYANASSLHGLSLLARGLPRVKADPSDMAARLDCQTGAWLSMTGIAAGVPMGASHGIGYVLGAVFDVPHGHTSCIMLPWVMRWNKPANADRQALIARLTIIVATDSASQPRCACTICRATPRRSTLERKKISSAAPKTRTMTARSCDRMR